MKKHFCLTCGNEEATKTYLFRNEIGCDGCVTTIINPLRHCTVCGTKFPKVIYEMGEELVGCCECTEIK